MQKNNKQRIFKVRRRPLHIWILRLIWFAWLVFWAEVAFGSRKEMEPKAFLIALIVFIGSFFIGCIFWTLRYSKFKKKQKLDSF